MKLTIHPLTPGHWPDLEALFHAKGCAIARAAKRGVKRLEACPIDKPQRSHDEFVWHGAARSMFDAAGFEAVARRKPQRPVVRLRLA